MEYHTETLMNPHFNSFHEINFNELLDIILLLDITKGAYLGYIDWLKFGELKICIMTVFSNTVLHSSLLCYI